MQDQRGILNRERLGSDSSVERLVVDLELLLTVGGSLRMVFSVFLRCS
jgi:hypothetical protein